MIYINATDRIVESLFRLIMFARSGLTRFRRVGRLGREFRVAGVLAAALWVLSILAIGASQASPRADEASNRDRTVAAAVHVAAANGVLVANTSPTRPADESDTVGSSGCGTICAPALLAVGPALILEQFPSNYVLPQPADFAATAPPPEFRPPRTFA